jgi:2-hydroxychromene-2-carboxylate isomerase
VEPGETDIWDRPKDDTGLFALQFAVSVRDQQSNHFLDLHSALYNYRHEQNGNLSDIDSVGRIAQSLGINVETVMADIASGRALETVKQEHTRFAESHAVWGVPTFIVGSAAVFVRLLDRPKSTQDATQTVERILANIGWDNLNEFKHTSVPR